MNENKSEQELHTENLANQETAAGEGGELNLSIEEQLAQATQKLTEMQDSFLRAKAEGENIRRRAQEDVSKAHKFAIESFAEAMVPVRDSLEADIAGQARAILALTVAYSAFIAEVFRAGIQSVDRGQVEAAQAAQQLPGFVITPALGGLGSDLQSVLAPLQLRGFASGFGASQGIDVQGQVFGGQRQGLAPEPHWDDVLQHLAPQVFNRTRLAEGAIVEQRIELSTRALCDFGGTGRDG